MIIDEGNQFEKRYWLISYALKMYSDMKDDINWQIIDHHPLIWLSKYRHCVMLFYQELNSEEILIAKREFNVK